MQKVKILVVDDHKIVRDGIKSLLLEDEKYELLGEAENGKIAIEFLKNNPIDLVIMDINMPEMNGIDCTRIINEQFPDTRVLILSMHDEELYLKKILEAGASGFILKSFGKEELFKAIDRIIKGLHYYSQEITLSVLRELAMPGKEEKKVEQVVLTDREFEILELIVKEFTNPEIAEKLDISIRTVDAHRRNLLEKIGARNTAGLVKYAIENNLFKL